MLSARLSLWRASMGVLVGGLLAQLIGAGVSDVVRALLRSRGATEEALEASAWVIVPAMVASACSLIAVALFMPALSSVPTRSALGLRSAKPSTFIAAALGTIMLGPAADALMRGMQILLPDLSLGVIPLLHELVGSIPWYVAWPAFALLPGVSEELMFRGMLQNAASSRRKGILISGAAFALFHVDPHHIAGVLPLGFFLAWVASRSGTSVTIVAHIANNSAAIAVVHSATFDVGYGTDAPMPWSWLPISLALTALSAWIIVRDTRYPSSRVTTS